MPYWRVERLTEMKTLEGKTFEIVIGWILTDDSGNSYRYGDMAYCESTDSTGKCSGQGATSYELGFPAFGHVGEIIEGADVPYPTTWNLAQIDDRNGNSVRFSYARVWERIRSRFWKSRNRYTKESYLEEAKASTGAAVKFVLGKKGLGNFEGEFVDAVGKDELDEGDEIDAFVDPLERKFLSKIELYGMDGKILQTVGLCYRPLKLSPSLDSDENKKFVKRLLTDIVWANSAGVVAYDGNPSNEYVHSKRMTFVTNEYVNKIASYTPKVKDLIGKGYVKAGLCTGATHTINPEYKGGAPNALTTLIYKLNYYQGAIIW